MFFLLLFCSSIAQADIYVNQETVSISWMPSSEPDVQGYEVHRSTSPAGSYSKAHAGLIAQASWTDAGVIDGETYYYKLRASDLCGNLSDFSSTSEAVIIDITEPSVSASPAAGTYLESVTITLVPSEAASIYYTTDGTLPTVNSNIYSAPISITTDMTLRFFAVDFAGNESDTVTSSYVIIPHQATIASGPSGSTNLVDSGGTVTCSVTAEDTLGHAIDYQWSATGGSFSNATSQNPTWHSPSNTSGITQSYTISVTAGCTDTSVSGSFSVGVLSVADSITITSGPSGTPDPVDSGGTVSCSVSATDTLGHAIGYRWSATGGSFSNTVTQNPIWYAPENTSGSTQAYTITVTANCGGTVVSDSFIQQVLTAVIDDADGDGVADDIDNCPLVYNPGQGNVDGDNKGDA
jgi:hypothetical protein